MRIAQVAPLFEDVPPTGYGGTERVIAGLCDGLVAAGHDVTLFATGRSRTSARLESFVDVPLREDLGAEEMTQVAPHVHLRMLRDIFARGDEFQIIHAHTDVWTLPFVDMTDTPTLSTMHGRLDIPLAQQALSLYPGAALVSISDHQRLAVEGFPIDWLATIPNGLDLDAYQRQPRGDGTYLAFVGRLCPEKRPDLAVQIAARTGWPLRVAAKIDPTDAAYFEQQVAPLFEAHDVDFVGELGEEDKPAFYAGAAATLFPSDWPEPFGLVMIESLAAGTPVIALRRGSVPEVLQDGICGFICDDAKAMVDAVGRVGEIEAAACRRRASTFSVENMCTQYLQTYEQLLTSTRPTTSKFDLCAREPTESPHPGHDRRDPSHPHSRPLATVPGPPDGLIAVGAHG
jgi:glycosyltransferase involved in cell wall biosynthesis